MLLNPISNLFSPWDELELDGVELINDLGGPLVACWVELPVASGHQERFANLNGPGLVDGEGQGLPALPGLGGNVEQLDVLLGAKRHPALIGLPSELLLWG